MDVDRSEPPATPAGWLPGLFLGALNGILLLSFGTVGLGFTAVALLLIAWKGPRFVAAAGLLTGVGLIWTVLFVNVGVSCVLESLQPGHECGAPGIWPWVAAAVGIFASGLIASAVAFRRARSRR